MLCLDQQQSWQLPRRWHTHRSQLVQKPFPCLGGPQKRALCLIHRLKYPLHRPGYQDNTLQMGHSWQWPQMHRPDKWWRMHRCLWQWLSLILGHGYTPANWTSCSPSGECHIYGHLGKLRPCIQWRHKNDLVEAIWHPSLVLLWLCMCIFIPWKPNAKETLFTMNYLQQQSDINNIQSNFPHDLTGHVMKSGTFPIASGSYGNIYKGTLNVRGGLIDVCHCLSSQEVPKQPLDCDQDMQDVLAAWWTPSQEDEGIYSLTCMHNLTFFLHTSDSTENWRCG